MLHKYSITRHNFLEGNHLQELYVLNRQYYVTHTHSGSQPDVDSVLCLGLLVHNADIGRTLTCARSLPTGVRSAQIFLPPVDKTPRTAAACIEAEYSGHKARSTSFKIGLADDISSCA